LDTGTATLFRQVAKLVRRMLMKKYTLLKGSFRDNESCLI